MEQLFYIVRHGETDFNKQNIVQGSGVDTELNERGKEQAQLFYDMYKDTVFDRVYTSALRRSMQSVKGFIDKGIAHTSLRELNEISWGDFEGKLQTPEERALYWEIVNKWNAGELDVKIQNGESPLEMQRRQKVAIHHILQQIGDGNILICMHGRAMKSFLCLLLDEPLTKMEEFQHQNMCLYLLRYDGKKFELIKKNDTTHLNII